MGNQVGPVAAIAIGIWIGYIVLTGRAAQFIALVSGQSAVGVTTAPSKIALSQEQAGGVAHTLSNTATGDLGGPFVSVPTITLGGALSGAGVGGW